MSESDVSDSKHEECGDPGPGPGRGQAGCPRGVRAGWLLLAVAEAAARMGGWSRCWAGAGPRHLICSVTSDPG